MVNSIYSLIETHVVSQMTPVITLTEIETIAGTPVKYKLYSCNTQWLTINDKITIDGVVYRIVEFVQNEYLIVTGASAPVQLYFQMDAPRFEHGTHRRVNSERNKTAAKRSITPMIYMLPAKGTKKPSIDSIYGFIGKVRFFFLTTFDAKGDQTISTQQTNVVNPMAALSQYFFDKMEAREDIFCELENIYQDDFMDFGDPATWGVKERIFDEFLSGVGAIADTKIYEQALKSDCCTGEIQPETCMPVKFKIEGVQVETINSGDTFDLNLIDTNGGVPVHSYDPSTNTLEVPAPGAGIDIELNSQLAYEDQMTDVNIPIINSLDQEVGTWNGTGYKIGNSEVEINDSAGGPLHLVSVPAEGAAVQQISDSTVNVKDSDGTIIHTKTVKAQATADQTVSNSTVNVKDSAGATLHVVSVKAEATANQTVSDGSVLLKNAQGDTLQTITNKAEEAKSVTMPIIYIRPQTSGYTTSYLTGDDGWKLANNPDPYIPPAVGIAAVLDPNNPRKLRYKNAFGHYERFTGINGGYYDYATGQYKLADGTVSDQTTTFGTVAANTSYLIDHHTGLGWKWNIQGVATWSTHVTNAHASTHAGYTDWEIPSRPEMMSIETYNLGNGLLENLVPFNANGGSKTSTPALGSETTRHAVATTNWTWAFNDLDTTNRNCFFVRRHYT